MQLTDAEIREILIREKKRRKQRQRRKRRRTLLILLLLIIAVAAVIAIARHNKQSSASSSAGTGSQASATYTGDIRGVVFIDPGHGGMDSGSDDGNGRYEKNDTLALALALKPQLEALGFTVEMSREEDVMVDRTLRGEMANKCGARLMVSIHRNKSVNPDEGEGVEAFISKEDTAESRMLADNILSSLSKRGFALRTVRAGTLVSTAEDYEENAAAKMPSCLVEVGFINSSHDNALFDSSPEQNARAMADAIDITFMSLYEPDKAAEYARQRQAVDSAAAGITESTLKAVSGITGSPQDPGAPAE